MSIMEEMSEARGVAILVDIAQVITDSLLADKVDPQRAREVGLQAADLVRQTYGGEQLYIPKGLALIISARDRQIYADYNGSNTALLAKKHGLTERQIYGIIARIRADEFRARQPGLFEGD